MLRICSIGFIVLLLLDGAASALAEENGEPAGLLADEKTTLSIAGNNAACFEYGNGIKFTAAYYVLKDNNIKYFVVSIDGCRLNFEWSRQMFRFNGKGYVVLNGDDVSVEITDRVRMHNMKGEGYHSCNFKKDSKVNVTITCRSDSDCQGLSLVFDNAVCDAATTTTKKPSPANNSDSKDDGKGSGLSPTALVLIIVGSIVLLIFVAVAIAVAIYFCCDREYSSSSSSSSGRSHRTKVFPMSSVRNPAVSDKTKERSQAETSGIEDSRRTEKVAALKNAQVFDEVIKSFEKEPKPEKPTEKKPEPKKVKDKKPEPKKVNIKKPELKKVNDKKPEPKKSAEKKPEPKKVNDKKPEPMKLNEKKPEPKKMNDKKPEPKKSTEKKPEPKKVDDSKLVRVKEEAGKQTKDKDIKPKFIALDSKRKLIAEGARRGEDSYPTMEDVDSDWGDGTKKGANSKKKHKK